MLSAFYLSTDPKHSFDRQNRKELLVAEAPFMFSGRAHQLLLGLAVIMMFVPTFMYFEGSLQKPPMWEGDELVQVTCPTCDGEPGEKECSYCKDRGLVSAIKPGQHRPLYLIGTVVDQQEQPLEGASVEVSTWAEPLHFETSAEGQFGVKLPPGTYTIKVEAEEGAKALTKSVVFPENRDLIYLPAKFEMGGLLHELQETFVLNDVSSKP